MKTFRRFLPLATVATILLTALSLSMGTLRPVQAQASLLLRLYHDRNHDAQAQPSEAAAAQAYTLAWSDGDHALSSTGLTDAQGYVYGTDYITGTWTLHSDCLTYTFVITGPVAGQAVTDLPICPTYPLYLPIAIKGGSHE